MESTEQNYYDATDEMKRLLAIVKQQSTYSDVASQIKQLELLASAIRGSLSALHTKQDAETNKTYSTTAVAKKRLKPKGKAVPKPKPKQPQQQPKAVANAPQPNANLNSAVELAKQMKQELEHPNYPSPNPLPNRTTPYKTNYPQ